MSKESGRKRYKAYFKEFRHLREEGCRFYYPDGTEVSPKFLAEKIAYDTDATYMRDHIYDQERKVMRISFTRIAIRNKD
ncbi:MAG: hypothetical protein Q4A32_06295 [Lachnospiraceae bacterium]|nr:hypothetical protein [Lachnospiraceae bacterium]